MKKLEDILNPTGNVLDSDEKIQRDALKKAIKNQTDEATELNIIISSVIRWRNKTAAIALWAGHIEKADELHSGLSRYNSPERVEASLIERFGQPVYQEHDYTKEELVNLLVPVIQSSPISDLRPDIWDDEKKARKRVKWVVDNRVEKKDW